MIRNRQFGFLFAAAVAAAVVAALGSLPAAASGISGTLSNFDVFNDTSTISDGAELELEGCHASDVYNTYPSHYLNTSIAEYTDAANNFLGTRITFVDYQFGADDLLDPQVGQNTNGHMCVNTPGCEHFGFAVQTQPTATRFFWHDQNGMRIGDAPLTIPNATWNYVPPVNPGDRPVIQAAVEVPELEVPEQRADSIWMKVYKTEIDRPVTLEELISGVINGIVPEDEIETETEWELLEGGLNGDKEQMAEDEIDEGKVAVIRRYEYFKYTGAYDAEHEPLTAFLDGELLEPPLGELGDFIAANMVAANLVPEPAAIWLVLSEAGLCALALRRRVR